MIRGLYSAASGMNATALQQDAIAQNLSNSIKPGYLRQLIRFEASGTADQIQGPAASVHTDHRPGTMQFTGQPLDLSLEGPGFFAIEGPTGPVYTRNGVFQLNQEGRVVTMDGLAALGIGGPIELPVGTAGIEVQGNGAIVADGIEVDQLRIVAFADPTKLQRVGASYFQAPANLTASPELPYVYQGYRELSNSTMVEEMVQMIAGVRHFEAAQRALRSIGDAIAFNTRPLNR